MNTSFQKYRFDFIVLIVIYILIAIFYGNTLRNGYIHDDHGQVESNTYIQSLLYLPKILTGCIWESAVGDCKQTYYYRPLQSLSYMMTYALSSQPWVFHLVNLLYFSVCIFLTYRLALLISGSRRAALLTALLFLIHPLNSETVNWIATVPELLYTIFCLGSMYYFIRYRATSDRKYLSVLIVFYTLGIFSKEPAVFLLGLFGVWDMLRVGWSWEKYFRWEMVEPYLYSLVSVAVYMGLRFATLGGLGEDPTKTYTLYQRILIFFDLLGSYIHAFVWPYPLNLFYVYHAPSGPTEGSVGVGIGVMALLIIIVRTALHRRKTKVVFGIAWFILFLLPSQLFLSSIGENLFAERHAFISTIGYTFLLALFGDWIWRRTRYGRYIICAVLIGVSIVSGCIIMRRNTEWRTDETIYTKTLHQYPTADLIRYNLALIYRDRGELEHAKQLLLQISTRNTGEGLYKVYNNIGDIARKQGNVEEAKRWFERSITGNPMHMSAYINLGALNFEHGDILSSIQTYCHANQLDPTNAMINHNYDLIIQRIQAMNTTSYQRLMTSIQQTFRPLPDSVIVFHTQTCPDAMHCVYVFSTQFVQGELILPYLVGVIHQDGTVSRPMNVVYTPQERTFEVVIDTHDYERVSGFLIPTCSASYTHIGL